MNRSVATEPANPPGPAAIAPEHGWPLNWNFGMMLTNSRRLSLRENWKFGTLMTNTFRPAPNGEPLANLPLSDCRPSPEMLLQRP
jgi:hypothetical protein